MNVHVRAVAAAVAGMAVMGVGIAMILAAGAGAGPFDVMMAALVDRFGMTFTTAGLVVHTMLAVVAVALGRRPGLLATVAVFAVGPTIDVALPTLAAVGGLWQLPAGVVVFAVGLAGYLHAGVGQAPAEAVMVALESRRLPRWAARGVLDALMLAGGFALGGPVGVGTLLAAVATGPAVGVASDGFARLPSRRPARPATVPAVPVG